MTIPLTMLRLPLLAVIAAFSTGCFGPPTVNYDMIPVEGTITFEGEPLANAEVMFDSADFPRGFGTTDENGRFKVITRQFGAGLPAGTYRVLVTGSEKTRVRLRGVGRGPRVDRRQCRPLVVRPQGEASRGRSDRR